MTQTQIVQRRAETMQLASTSRDPASISAKLQHAAENYHLIAPATSIGALPEGMAVTTSAVLVDVKNETYRVGAKVALSKSALDRIAAAAGVSWDPTFSRRVDDGADPLYCHYKAVGTLRSFDGTIRTIVGEKVMDMRAGSAALAGKQATEVAMQRTHLLAHAETKARLRAIRSLGLRTSYAPEELEKPFVAARLQFTGQTDDPGLRREFAVMAAQSMLGASSALYGRQAAPEPVQSAPALPAPQPAPPVGSVHDEDDEPAQAPAPRAAAPARASTASGPVPEFMFGRQKGRKITDLDVPASDLEWYAGAVEQSIADPSKARFRDSNQRVLDAIRAELDARASGGVGDGGIDDRGDDPDRY